MKQPTQRPELHIIDQIRTYRAREYALASRDTRLVLHVEHVEEGDQWRVDAKGRYQTATIAKTASGTAPTRIEALRAAAFAWRGDEQVSGTPNFDWEVVEALLTEVRAFER